MKRITALQSPRNRQGRVNVFLDGEFAFGLSPSLVQELGLKTGQGLSYSEIEELIREDSFRTALEVALRYLSYRPRSEAELRVRLGCRFDGEIIARVARRLKEQGLLDDAAFAQLWRENRESVSPRSCDLLKRELMRKGIDRETAARVAAGVDDEANAYRAARKKAGTLRNLDYPSFRRKLGAFLGRRGFGYELARRTIDWLWQEREGRP